MLSQVQISEFHDKSVIEAELARSARCSIGGHGSTSNPAIAPMHRRLVLRSAGRELVVRQLVGQQQGQL